MKGAERAGGSSMSVLYCVERTWYGSMISRVIGVCTCSREALSYIFQLMRSFEISGNANLAPTSLPTYSFHYSDSLSLTTSRDRN